MDTYVDTLVVTLVLYPVQVVSRPRKYCKRYILWEEVPSVIRLKVVVSNQSGQELAIYVL